MGNIDFREWAMIVLIAAALSILGGVVKDGFKDACPAPGGLHATR